MPVTMGSIPDPVIEGHIPVELNGNTFMTEAKGQVENTLIANSNLFAQNENSFF